MRSQRPFQFDVLRSFSCLARSLLLLFLLLSPSSSSSFPPASGFSSFPVYPIPFFLQPNSRFSTLSVSPLQIFAQSRSSSDSFRLFAKLYGPFLKNSSGHDCQPVDEDANQRSRIIFTSLLISSSPSNLIPRNADRKRVIRIPFLSLQTHPRHLSLPLLSKRIPINER